MRWGEERRSGGQLRACPSGIRSREFLAGAVGVVSVLALSESVEELLVGAQ